MTSRVGAAVPTTTTRIDKILDDPIAASGAGVVALLVASALSGQVSTLIAAFAGGATYAGVSLLLASEPTSSLDLSRQRGVWEGWFRHVAAFAIVFSLVSVTNQVTDAPRAFFCAAAVPWSPGIFAAGAYVLAILVALNRRRGNAGWVHVVWIGIAWIAPWYGFFSIATMLGAGLALGCQDREVLDYAYLAMLGTAASLVGSRLGNWLAEALPADAINPYQDL